MVTEEDFYQSWMTQVGNLITCMIVTVQCQVLKVVRRISILTYNVNVQHRSRIRSTYVYVRVPV